MTGIPDHALDRMRSGLATPSRIGGRYELVGLLGRGGMGEVHRARDHHLGRDVAIKLLAREASAVRLAERLERESRVLARLEHPGIVPVYDAGALDDGRVYYVMRLVDGVRLDEFARRGASRGELLRTLRRVAEAVAFAHGRGIVHRDLKPGNVMIGPFGEVLVLDWGVAKLLAEDSGRPTALPTEGSGADGARSAPGPRTDADIALTAELTADGASVGTPGYMAPEQVAQGGEVDVRADVFALGVMLRELLAVHPERVAKPLAAIVACATAPTPAGRYPGVAALSEDLRRWLDDEPVRAHNEGVLERGWRFARRHQAAILLLLTYAVVRTVILLWRGI